MCFMVCHPQQMSRIHVLSAQMLRPCADSSSHTTALFILAGSAMASSSSSMDVDEDIEAKRAMSAQMAWGGASPKQASSQQAAPQAGKVRAGDNC